MTPQDMPPMGQEPDDSDDAPGATTICIMIAADGSMSVGLDGGEMTPAKDETDALKQALQLMRDNATGGSEQQGYESAAPMPVPPQAVKAQQRASARGML